MMAALGLDVGAHLSADDRFKQVAAVMKKRDLLDRKQQKDLRRQQKLDKKVRVTRSMLLQAKACCIEAWCMIQVGKGGCILLCLQTISGLTRTKDSVASKLG